MFSLIVSLPVDVAIQKFLGTKVLVDELGTQFILSRVAAVLRSNVMQASQAASNLGLTTSTVLDGLGLTEEEYFLADYMACLLTVSFLALINLLQWFWVYFYGYISFSHLSKHCPS